jgi:hypothetical protein
MDQVKWIGGQSCKHKENNEGNELHFAFLSESKYL